MPRYQIKLHLAQSNGPFQFLSTQLLAFISEELNAERILILRTTMRRPVFAIDLIDFSLDTYVLNLNKTASKYRGMIHEAKYM